MTKRRNSQAVAAWSRHQGAHSPGTKKPDVDDTAEQLAEIENEDCEFGHPDCHCLGDSREAKAKGLLYTGTCKAVK